MPVIGSGSNCGTALVELTVEIGTVFDYVKGISAKCWDDLGRDISVGGEPVTKKIKRIAKRKAKENSAEANAPKPERQPRFKLALGMPGRCHCGKKLGHPGSNPHE
jgi:hypothetical protein